MCAARKLQFMIHSFLVTGMTCNGCLNKVKKAVESIDGVSDVAIDLSTGRLSFEAPHKLNLELLQSKVPLDYPVFDLDQVPLATTKWKQLKPLALIFIFLFGTVFLIHIRDWQPRAFMLDAMAGFFLIFSFFKLLDVPGFVSAFCRYDPLAKRVTLYAWIYPFIELLLGLSLLLRYHAEMALIMTIVVLGLTTIGVVGQLRKKVSIECACLGTTLNLPMTEATLIENIVMLSMTIFTLCS
jgi:copper chaperone CopZ